MVGPASRPMSRVGRYSTAWGTPAASGHPTGLSPPLAVRSRDLQAPHAAQRAVCCPLPPGVPTPRRHRQQAVPPPRFGLRPVRSPLLGASSLFLGVLRCFSSPGSLRGVSPRSPARRGRGCPIRRPPAHRLPAPPRGVSPRGRVLRRPPPPRHPPCALLRDGPQLLPPGTSRPSPSSHASSSHGSANPIRRPTRSGRSPPSGNPGRCPACSNAPGPATCWAPGLGAVRAACCRRSAARPSRESGVADCQRTRPRWAWPRARPPTGATPGSVEPRGLEPRTPAVQRRCSPNLSYDPNRSPSPATADGGRAWTRTRGLGLIRAAL